jgi:hypothetical protein
MREDFSAVGLRRLARVAKDVRQCGRLLSIAAASKIFALRVVLGREPKNQGAPIQRSVDR